MMEFFHSVSILALAWIVISHTLEITRLKNKIDTLLQDIKTLSAAKADPKPRKTHKHHHYG